jgi:hypothetical protein
MQLTVVRLDERLAASGPASPAGMMDADKKQIPGNAVPDDLVANRMRFVTHSPAINHHFIR